MWKASHSRSFDHYAATRKKPVLRNGRSVLRKGAEFTLVPVAEFVLSKRRILEIYLNVVEWGPGIYGAESARTRSPRRPRSASARRRTYGRPQLASRVGGSPGFVPRSRMNLEERLNSYVPVFGWSLPSRSIFQGRGALHLCDEPSQESWSALGSTIPYGPIRKNGTGTRDRSIGSFRQSKYTTTLAASPVRPFFCRRGCKGCLSLD
jgi:Transglycosylase